jgi:hypothetical protein
MIATRIRQRLESDTIRIPNASEFIGKDVEVIVLVEPAPEDLGGDNPRKRILGSAKGKIWIAPDFDAPLPDDLLKEFYK